MDCKSMVLTVAMILVLFPLSGLPCTSLLVSRGASQDSSVTVTYTCDGEFHPHLEYIPAADHAPGDSLEITDRHGRVRGKIAEVAHTYAVVGLMNEHQLAIGETTFDGHPELENPDGLLHYFDLMILALQRARTAREAIMVMTDLAERYGYRATGESFSIADTREVWIMEMIGPGPGGKGTEWVARRVPDGYIACHANKARIGEFPLNDPKNCLYSANVISFAVEKGYYDPASGKPFRFCDAYYPPTPKNLRYGEARVWSIFRRAAPSLNLPPDYHRAKDDATPYPLWIKPDKKLSLSDIFALMRDHYEGTPFDMTQGIEAGPYGSPYRWRPITWSLDSVAYGWERAISTQQTAFSFVSQSRSYLSDPVGGVYWYGLDDTYMSCYFPLYCGIDRVPEPYMIGSMEEFSWESAWWVFNLTANLVYQKYSLMIPELTAVQKELESSFLQMQPTVEKIAVGLLKSDTALAIRSLSDYSVTRGEMVFARWQKLCGRLIAKYNDGFHIDDSGEVNEIGYPEKWLRQILPTRPEYFRMGPK